MKKALHFIVLMAMASNSLYAQNWVRSFGSTKGNTEITGVVTDTENHPIIAGSFSSGKLEIDAFNTLNNNGITDVFLVKYDTAGNMVWKLSFGGEKEEYVSGICLDEQDNIYITGNFRSSSFKIGDRTVSSAWPDNIYVAKFTPDGVLEWLSHSTGISYYAWPTAVRFSGSRGILFTGSTNASSITFGNIDFSVNSGYSKGYYGVIDKDGNFLHADLVGEEGETGSQYSFNDITSDTEGNLYIAGSKSIHTEPDPITWSDYRDVMYLCRIGSDGKTDWVIEDTALYQADRILRNNDSLFVAGSREEYRIIFNGGTIDTTSAFYYGAYDLVGNNLWGHKHVGALAYDAFAQGGSFIVVGGLLLDHLDLGAFQLHHLDLGAFQLHRNADSSSVCPIYQDIFYLETDKSGNLRQAKSISGSLEDISTGVWLSGNGDLYYSGIFESYSMTVEGNDIINNAELSVFQHVSGTYYDRSIFTFVARSAVFGSPGGTSGPLPMHFGLYPNPAQEQVRIELDGTPGEPGVRLFDMHGRSVDALQTFSDKPVLDLSGLSPGMYIISVTAGN
ncbi:MAG: T9SS type A sorting domain-containing protein, partial [Bacteroidales bacterium]|nr:T9SS type A sorting domain-containing protein [Bacteroidales bacterium]